MYKCILEFLFLFQFAHFRTNDARLIDLLKKNTAGTREGTNKLESAFINKPLLSMSEVHVCFYSREHCIESFFFFLLPKTALQQSNKKKWNRCIELPINSMIVKKKKKLLSGCFHFIYLFIIFSIGRRRACGLSELKHGFTCMLSLQYCNKDFKMKFIWDHLLFNVRCLEQGIKKASISKSLLCCYKDYVTIPFVWCLRGNNLNFW